MVRYIVTTKKIPEYGETPFRDRETAIYWARQQAQYGQEMILTIKEGGCEDITYSYMPPRDSWGMYAYDR